uniref:Putative von Willebrand factor A domain-containing protein n=1 Tax=viral metagenome TaxID=1070528 RepID=A0A6M3KAE6_9ZZZZ
MFDLESGKQKLVDRQSVKGRKPTLKEMLSPQVGKQKKSLLLADISGSMHGAKEFALKAALAEIWKSHPGLECVGFADDLFAIEPSDLQAPESWLGGGTHMLKALFEAWHRQVAHMVLLTDGQPTDASEERIIQEAQNHKDVPIDTIGLGDQGVANYHPDFLRMLSHVTGGKFTDVGEPVRLTAVLETLLIEAQRGVLSEGSQGGGAIRL